EAEASLQRMLAVVGGVRREVDGGEVGGGGDGEEADEDRGRVQPARPQVSGGVADRDAVGGDAADRGAERERNEDRGEGEERVDPSCLSRRPGARAQRIGGAAEDEPE